MIKKMAVILPVIFFSLSGCTLLTPDYEQPKMEIPAAWNTGQGEILQKDWWTRFNDPTLNALVNEAFKNNKGLAQAMARVEMAQAGLGIARDALFPVPVASGTAQRTMARDEFSPIASKSNNIKNVNAYTAGLSATWNIDLWGKYWNQAESSRMALLASEAAQENVRQTLAAATVEAYFWLSSHTWSTEISAKVLAGREEELKLYETRHKYGQLSDLDLLSFKANVEAARSALSAAKIARNASETALEVLIGRSPADILKEQNLTAPSSLMTSLPNTPVIPSGIPSQLLENRPDIRQAEANLRAMDYDIGAARAEFFPQISLTGLLGSLSTDLSKVLASSNQYAALSGGITLPLNFWTIARNLSYTEAKKKEAKATYELTVLNAFKNVQDALVEQREYALSVDALTKEVNYLDEALRHARNRYKNGFTSYLETLSTERVLFVAQQQLAVAHAHHLASIAKVCLALGGNWQD